MNGTLDAFRSIKYLYHKHAINIRNPIIRVLTKQGYFTKGELDKIVFLSNKQYLIYVSYEATGL